MSGQELLAFAAASLAVVAAAPSARGTVRAVVGATTGVVRSVAGALEALLRLGREGCEPGALERRRLLACGGAAGLCVAGLFAGPIAGAVVALAAPAAVARVLHARRAAYRRAVAADAPAIAAALADALAGGHSVRGALLEAANGLGGAAGAELRRVRAALAAGQATEAALEDLRTRCSAPAVDALVAAALVHSCSGGDLGALLRRLARAFEDERRLDGEVHAATAQARFTAALVVGLPLGGAALAELARPGSAAAVADSSLTGALVVLALVLQGAAAILIRSLGKARA